MTENPESAQETLIQLHIQRAVAPARQFRKEATEAEDAGDFRTARALQQQVVATYDQAENVQLLATEIEEVYKTHRIEQLPLGDFLESILANSERPLLASLFSNPLIQEAIRTQVPREIIHQIFSQEEVDIDNVLRKSRGRTGVEKKQIRKTRERGERTIMVGRVAFSTDEDGPQTYDQVVIAANPAVFHNLSAAEIDALSKNNVKGNTGQVLDIIEKQISGPTGTRGIPKILLDYYEELRQDPFITSMTPREREIYFFRQSGDDIKPGEKDWKQLLAEYKTSQSSKEPDIQPIHRSLSNTATSGQEAHKRLEGLPPLVDLDAFQDRIARFGLRYVPGRGLTDPERRMLLSKVYQRQLKEVKGEALESAIERLGRDYDEVVSRLQAKLSLARKYIERGKFEDGEYRYLEVLIADIEESDVLRELTDEEIGQLLERKLPESEMEKRASERKVEKQQRASRLAAEHIVARIEVGPVTSTQYLRELVGEGDQQPPSE